MRKGTTRKHIEQSKYSTRSLRVKVIQLIRINTRQYDMRTQSVYQQKKYRVENTDSKIFDLKNISYGLYQVLHAWIMAVLPPLASIACFAVAENA